MESSRRKTSLLVSVALFLLALSVNSAQGQGNPVSGGLGQLGQLATAPLSVVGSVPGVMSQFAKPVSKIFDKFGTGIKVNEFSDNPIPDSLIITNGVLDGFATGIAAATNMAGVSKTGGSKSAALRSAAITGAAANALGGGYGPGFAGGLAGSTAGVAAAANALLGSSLHAGSLPGGAVGDYGFGGPIGYGAGLAGGAGAPAAVAASGAQAAAASLESSLEASSAYRNAAALNTAAYYPGALQTRATEQAVAAAVNNNQVASGASVTGNMIANANHVAGRQLLASEALSNAQAESAIAGADMAAHGANNARSASLASNAYRQAKLATARDRVNIAGTIQNSARISDAAIATHDAATKAEDSLLGSELAVDSAATVLDSDAAYIPPVTNSMLRSLPYGRIGLRNIIPKPLTYPSVFLPDVWLNGQPVNYLNVPFRMMPHTFGPQVVTNPLQFSGHSLANGFVLNGQPFYSNNGILLNGMVVDPSLAHLATLANGVYGSSVYPILANGQVEAQDEIAAANLITLQQQNGAGTSATYHGYGRFNSVPMLTGSVTDVNLAPTTTIGTTYPIGSALVIEPRDSYFQDYVDNASSRQNFDERQQ